MDKGYTTYSSMRIDTADQGTLILITYDVAIKHAKIALQKIEENDIEGRTKALFKSQDAIGELMSSLNMEVGDISRQLYDLYEYMLHCLVQANIHNDPGRIHETLGHLESLREAWDQAAQNVKKQQRSASAAPASSQAPAGGGGNQFLATG
jgi:flagellar protein FliS